MGCVQGRGYGFSPERFDRMKVDNGYVKGDGHAERRRQQQQYKTRDIREQEGNGRVEVEKRIIGRDQNKGRDGNELSNRKMGGDELVDGWPKWLIDNIPKEVLVGLVPKTSDSYDKLAKVGQGTYINVYKAKDRKSGKIVALKKVRFDTSDGESVKFMAREIIILKRLDHPNIIKLQGLATSRMQYSLYLVFDFMEYDLTKLIQGTLTLPQVKRYMEQLLSGLEHCHERGILHRDIKGSNLLIDKNGMLKIADFGLANFYQTKTKRPLTSRVVTLWYRAPELLLGSTDYGVGIDLWSAGCLLAEMFVGRPIMPGRNEVEQLHKIFKLCGSPGEEYWKKVKPPTTFRPPQTYEPSFGQVFPNLPHSAFPLLYTLLAVEPHFRGTAATALQNQFFITSPLACGLSELPVIKVEEDGSPQSIDITRELHHRKKLKGKRVRKNKEGYRKILSNISEYSAEEKQGESSMQGHSGANSSSFSLSRRNNNNNNIESPPPSPTPAFKFRNKMNQSAKTEAHPDALKNIKNYPILLASITEAAKHYEDNRLSLNRRAISTIDFRNHHHLDDNISKLFGLDHN